MGYYVVHSFIYLFTFLCYRKRTMLFAGASPTSEIDYDGHNARVKKQFKEMNLNLATVTHAFRSAGAQFLESVG